MKLKIYQVDAFTDRLFSGNPAAICPLDQWIDDSILQNIAMENNLAETAFYVKTNDGYHIRWFTPKIEIDLCGHATLATAYVLFNYENHSGDKIVFSSKSGPLAVTRKGGLLTMDFPADKLTETEPFPELTAGFDITPVRAFKGKMNYMVVFEKEEQIRQVKTDLQAISKLQSIGVIVTAKGDRVDFVSRFFAPQSGIDEDPVTGSAHTSLIPFWAKELGKNELSAQQLSPRGGSLLCKYLGDRVEISGNAKIYMIGSIETE